MELKNFFAQDLQGNVIASPTVYLYQPGTTTLATGLQDANGNPLTNPFTGGPTGQIQFAAPDGDYDLRVTGAGRDFTMRVRFVDASPASVQILREDLASPGGADLVGYDGGTAQDVLDNAKAMANYTALRAYTGRATGVRITQAGLAGFFQRDDADTTSADNGFTTIVDASGRRWKRLYSGPASIRWLLAAYSSSHIASNDMAPVIQAAIDAMPTFGWLHFDYDGTVLLDTSRTRKVVRGTNQCSAALIVTKPLKLTGSKTCTLKIKDFSTAWQQFVSGDSVAALIINSGFVHVDGLRVDCNSDNHYELNGAFKWWENGPTDKRPIDGIITVPTASAPNITNVLVENCFIDRPLCGVGFWGNIPSLNDATFLARTRKTGLSVGCVARNNTIHRARGNGILFNEGVIGCRSESNRMINGMYHAVKMYASVLDSVSINDEERVVSDDLIAKYNSTDNGYWRTDDTANTEFKILRAGFSISSGWSYSGGISNIVGCSIIGAKGTFTRSASHATYYSTTNPLRGIDLSQQSSGYIVTGCDVTGYPLGGIFSSASTLPGVFSPCVISNNSFSDTLVDGMLLSNLANTSVFGNTIDRAGTNNITLSGCEDVKVFDNSMRNKTAGGSIYGVYVLGSATCVRVGDNKFDSTFDINSRYNQQAASTPKIALPGAKQLLTYANGWIRSTKNYGVTGLSESWLMYGDGTVTMTLWISGAAKTGNVIATLPEGARPSVAVSFLLTCIDTPYQSYPVVIGTNGDVTVVAVAAGTALPDNLGATVTYQVPSW